MREKLKELEGKRVTVHAIFERFGTKTGWKGKPITTILLRDVTDPQGKPITDHLWFVSGKQFTALGLVKGDKVAFDARAMPYEKGYRGHRDDVDAPLPETDYKLSFPTKMRKLESLPTETLPLFSGTGI